MDDQIQVRSKRAQYAEVYHDVIDSRKLTINELAVFVALLRYAHRDTCEAFPSYQRLAKDLNSSKSTIRRTIESLIAKGVLLKESRYNDKGGQSSNLYTVIDDPDSWRSDEAIENDIKKMPVSSDLDRQIQASVADETDKSVINLQAKDITSIDLCQSSHGKIGEHFDMQWLKNHYDYYALVEVMSQTDADMLLGYIHDIVNSNQKTMTIEGTTLNSKTVIDRILDLNIDDLEFVLEKFSTAEQKVKNTKAYLRTIMYNAKAQSRAEINNSLRLNHVI